MIAPSQEPYLAAVLQMPWRSRSRPRAYMGTCCGKQSRLRNNNAVCWMLENDVATLPSSAVEPRSGRTAWCLTFCRAEPTQMPDSPSSFATPRLLHNINVACCRKLHATCAKAPPDLENSTTHKGRAIFDDHSRLLLPAYSSFT